MPDDLLQLWDRLNLSRDEKLKNIALLIKNESINLDTLEREAKNLNNGLKRKVEIQTNKVNSLKEWLRSLLGGEKLPKDPRYTSRITTSVKLEKEPGAEPPERFVMKELIEKTKVDEAGIKKAINNGERIEGYRVVKKKGISIT